MTAIAVLTALAGGVGAGGLGLAFSRYKGWGWFMAMVATGALTVVALWLLIAEEGASPLVLLVFSAPVLGCGLAGQRGKSRA